jgi:vancomycin resistance protein YoaR
LPATAAATAAMADVLDRTAGRHDDRATPMTAQRRAIFILVPLAILLLPLAVYAADRATSSDQVARNVTVAGVAVGGLDRSDATLAVQAHEQQLRQSPAVFIVNGQTFTLMPDEVGLTANTQKAVAEAMAARRTDGVVGNFLSWIASFGSIEDIPLELRFSDDAIEAQIQGWEVRAIPNPAFNGSVAAVDGEVVATYPRAGETIDRPSAHEAIVTEMSTLDKQPATLSVVTQDPTLSDADVDAAAAEMQSMIDDDITLRSNEVGFRTTITASQLASAVRSRLTQTGDALEVYFDEQTVLEILEPRRIEYEIQPVDAAFDIDLETNRIKVIPGRNGTLLDVDALLIEMKRVALEGGTGVFPLLVGAEPDFTTTEAESYTSLGLLAEFTTTHPAGEDRVINIHQMAKDVDGAIVQPGEEWSINDYVGQRTEAGGYVAAPAIINGVPYCCDHPANIGGGVSQFGTTLFNAVFYACLEDVDHKPHSLSFSRYPKGVEATLGYPGPDVRFRNDTDAPVIIKTAYTDTSITVLMYGDNGGKTCRAETAEPTDIVPFEEELVADEEGVVEPGERVKERGGLDGFFIHVDRVVTYPDGREEVDLQLDWRYSPLSELYKVHPCEVTGEPVDCPVKLPSLSGSTWDVALAKLQELGILAARVDEPVGDPDLDDVVLTQDPDAGEWVAPGTTIRLAVGVYSGDSGDG